MAERVRIVSEGQSMWGTGASGSAKWSKYVPFIGGDLSEDEWTATAVRFLPPDGRDAFIEFVGVPQAGEVVLEDGQIRIVDLPALVTSRKTTEPNHTVQIEVDLIGPDGQAETRTFEIKTHNAPRLK